MSDALRTIRAAAPEAPREPEALYRGALMLWREGRRNEAIKLMDAALHLKPDFADALCMGGYMLSESGKPQSAMRFYRRALELDASLVTGHINLGKLLFAAGRFTEALASFEMATKLAPHDPDAWCSRAGTLRELGRLDDSIETAKRALELRHDFPEAAINLGNALLKLDRSEDALEAYLRSSTPGPCLAKALLGQGLALRSLGRFSEAIIAFDGAATLGSREAVAGKGCLMLTLGDFENGLEGYEARWLKGKSISEALGTRCPNWKGLGRQGERVLVLNDHGLGDTIQFFRYLPLMAAAGVHVTFVCPPQLRRLLSSRANVRFVESPPEREPFDSQIAISSLPYAFGTRLETIPAAVPYLAAEPGLRETWLKRIGPEGFKIGVVWQGNSDPEADLARSMPLTALAPLAGIAGVRLISLQKGFGEGQLSHLAPTMRVETLGPNFDAGADAFVDTAAAMACLDLIITCDTSIAHLAGALALPVWVALKRDAEWRWMTERNDSPWYPTMHLFRQRRRGVWSDVFEAMASELAQLVERRSGPRVTSAPCSLGELIDKVTILRIKAKRIGQPEKLANVRCELTLLERLVGEDSASEPIDLLTDQLATVNGRLWDIEDALRSCEHDGDFGPRFVALARSVYCENDTRAAIKRAINALASSALIEEKFYA
jgi:tetratricopeptide (TPR) repeat protein